ncbi:hypothetical protein [Chitinophaga qingshengii]|uniref:PH domain-containing protein n=1 Tax=Chitinophaga qingshengii TaxID=1569794 RepID=A0ABR7TXC6_9BACT|nr:hypothetical protein [Chitinophaga qingshengii]MBC9934288.1 hypothetical protein [Chitinophaga qingshengii]
MTNYQFYQQVGTNIFKRKDQKKQYIVMALILFGVAAWFSLRYPGVSGFLTAGIATMFGLGFVNRMFNFVLIDTGNQTLTQKASLLAPGQTVALSDIHSLSINNRIYGLILISSAWALVNKEGKQTDLLLGQSLMNSKHTEAFLLETEKVLGRR